MPCLFYTDGNSMNFNSLINHETKTISWAALILTISASISRLLGLVRDWLLAKTFGASPDLDVYFAAFKIPDFVYNIVILGGISVAFLPLFARYFSQDKRKAWGFVSNVLNIFLILLIVVSILLFIFTPLLIRMVAPGFSHEQMGKTVLLTRIMFLSPIFFGLSSILSGILQHFNRFLVYSLCPLLYNLGIIFGILFLAPTLGILGVALGVILGSFLHLTIQIPSAAQCGFSWKPLFDLGDKRIKKVFLLMAPRTVGISAQQINLVVMGAVASTLGEGAVSIFNFANNIQYFPVGIIGVSFALALFPTLSKSWGEGRKDEFVQKFRRTFFQVFYLIIPISLAIFILREPIVKIILLHGQFSPWAAKITASALGLFCLGIFASSLIPLISRAFFSLQDTKTPTIIALLSMGFNVILSVFLTSILKPSTNYLLGIKLQEMLRNIFSLSGIENISILGLPLAVSLSAIFQLFLLLLFLRQKLKLQKS